MSALTITLIIIASLIAYLMVGAFLAPYILLSEDEDISLADDDYTVLTLIFWPIVGIGYIIVNTTTATQTRRQRKFNIRNSSERTKDASGGVSEPTDLPPGYRSI